MDTEIIEMVTTLPHSKFQTWFSKFKGGKVATVACRPLVMWKEAHLQYLEWNPKSPTKFIQENTISVVIVCHRNQRARNNLHLMNFRMVAGEDAESCRHSCICSYYTVVLSSYGHTCPEPHTQNKPQQILLPYQSAKQVGRKWLSENPATLVLPKNPTDRKPRNKNFSQCCTSRNQTLNQKKSYHAFSTCKTSCPRAPATEIFLSTMKLIKSYPEANTWSMPHQANPQTKKKPSMIYKSGVYILHGKREIPAVVVIWTPGRRGVRCGSSSFRQAWSKHHWHGYKTPSIHTLSAVICRGAKKRNKAKRSRFKTQTTKKRKLLAKCALRCDALEETSNQRSENECLLQTRNPRKLSPKETRSSEAHRRCRQGRKAGCIPPKWCRPTLPGGDTLGYVLK
jgi:hypothetical protein